MTFGRKLVLDFALDSYLTETTPGALTFLRLDWIQVKMEICQILASIFKLLLMYPMRLGLFVSHLHSMQPICELHLMEACNSSYALLFFSPIEFKHLAVSFLEKDNSNCIYFYFFMGIIVFYW